MQENQENSYHTHQILFQQLITGLKTRVDVVKYLDAITELSQQKNEQAIARCKQRTTQILNFELDEITRRHNDRLREIQTLAYICLTTPTPPSPEQVESCEAQERELREQAETVYQVEIDAAHSRYTDRIKECERLWKTPSKPWWRRLWESIELEPARNNI